MHQAFCADNFKNIVKQRAGVSLVARSGLRALIPLQR
jgi:hypothetical protein